MNSSCRSLKYCDLRLVDSGYLHRSAVEAEIGSISCYLNLNAAIYDSTYSKSVIIPTIRSSAGTTYLGPHLAGTQLVGVKNEAKETQEDSEMSEDCWRLFYDLYSCLQLNRCPPSTNCWSQFPILHYSTLELIYQAIFHP